ncbi:g11739 [Coccomyxa elongata]
MSESPEREVETGVVNGEDSHEEDRREDVDDKDRDGAHNDDDDEEEKVEKDIERSPSPRARSTSPAREATPDSRSRSPVQRARSDSRDRARSDSREDRRRRSRSGSRDNRRARYSRSRSRDRDYRRRSRSRDRGDRYRSRRSPSPRRDRYRSSRYSPDRRGRRSPIAPYYNRPRRTPPRHGTTLFVAGLNFVTTEREVESKFDKFGPVREARIVRNPVNGESRGFGFVAMKYEEDVDAAIRALDGAEWQGRRLGVERARNVK